jgi:hypothetical protein
MCGRSGEDAGAQPVEVRKRNHIDQLRVACGSGQQLVGRKRREVGSGVGKLPVVRRESVDRQHDAIAVTGERPLVDAVACLGIDVEAFGDEAVDEPCALAHAGQDTVAEDWHGRGPISDCPAKPAAEIPDGDLADSLRALGHAAGKTRLPLDGGDGDPMAEEEASPIALPAGSAAEPVVAAGGTPIAPAIMLLPRFGASTTTVSAPDAASGATIWKLTL